MKKLISITSIIVLSLSVYSCREADEIISYPYMKNLNKKQETGSSPIQAKDTLKTASDNEIKDPPIKDGQDWRLVSQRTIK